MAQPDPAWVAARGQLAQAEQRTTQLNIVLSTKKASLATAQRELKKAEQGG